MDPARPQRHGRPTAPAGAGLAHRACLDRLSGLAAIAAIAVLQGGCAAANGPAGDSSLTFARTFEVARAALVDQKLAISQQDPRRGLIIGDGTGVTITATLDPMPDGTTRVTFRQQPEGADPALLKRVHAAYAARMAQFGVLGAFKDGPDGGSGGPVPCPSGPAFCK